MKWFYLVLLLVPAGAAAIVPSWRYRVLHSEHFEVIHREDQKALARRYILAAEQAHELLLPIFKEGPSKTYVVLQDDTDVANGLADFLPYPHIVIYPVLPTQNDSVDEFGDWPLEVMLHEYAHILNMYPAHGIYWPFKYLLGSVVRPNAVLPRWYLEGLAVDLETRYTDFGRLRSPDTAAAARAYALADRFKTEDIATINESDSKTWPYGARPYLFGGWWWGEAHQRKGTDVIYTLNQNFSRRLPFLLNGPVREQLGGSAGEFFHQALTTVAERAQRQIAAVRATQPHNSADVIDDKGDALAFAISPSGLKLVYWLGVIDKGAFAYLRERETPQQSFKDRPAKKLFRSVGTYKVAWVSDDVFVFDQIDARHPRVHFRDIYRYDLKAEETTRLTRDLRAQEPAVSPNGQVIAMILNDGGKNSLAVMEANGKNPQTLVAGNLYQRIAGPAFLSDHEILFSGRNKKGDEKIYVYNLNDKKRALWNPQLSFAQGLRRTPAGILVTDAGTGIRNVYQISGGQTQAVSNTLTSIQFADYDPHAKTIVANELTPAGPRLKSFPLLKTQPPKIESPNYDPPLAPNTEKVKISDENYWPISYLRPRYIIPMIYPVEEGVIVQGITTARDPINRNIIGLSGSFDTVTDKPSYGASYQNNSFATSLNLDYSRYVTYLGASGRLIEANGANAGLSGNLGTRNTAWGLGGHWSETDGSTLTYRRMGPAAQVAYDGFQSSYNDRWSFSAAAAHNQYLEQDGYLAYGRSSAALGAAVNLGRHRVGLQVRGAVAPDLPFGYVLDLGERTVGGNYLVNLANSNFMVRGYPSGTFVGRRIVNGNLEWVMPATDVTRGFGTFPLFLRNVELVLFGDAVAVDGAAFYNSANAYIRSRLREYYVGTGGEIRLNTSVAYHVPLAFTLGLYYGLKDEYGGGFTPFLGVGLGGLGPISKKTP